MRLPKQICILFACSFLFACGGGGGESNSNTVTAKITVAKLPAQIEINKTTTGDNTVEYWWSVTFDVNDDSIINEGDIVLVLSHAKMPGSQVKMVNVSDLQANIAEMVPSGSDYAIRSLGDIAVIVADNTITLTASKNEYSSSLAGITSTTRVYFHSLSIDDMGIQHRDYAPEMDTYANVTADGKFSDQENDIMNDNSLKHIDIISMQISIN